MTRRSPAHLYHGTPVRGLSRLVPPSGGFLYATDCYSLATVFLAQPCYCVVVKDAIHACIADDREAFARRDSGGCVYVVPREGFACAGHGGEWRTGRTVEPCERIEYASALDTMLEHGVHVHFVSAAVAAHLRSTPDQGLAILSALGARATGGAA